MNRFTLSVRERGILFDLPSPGQCGSGDLMISKSPGILDRLGLQLAIRSKDGGADKIVSCVSKETADMEFKASLMDTISMA